MAMELDDVIEVVNREVDKIEEWLGEVGDRTETVAAWLIMVERGIGIVKEDWCETYKDEYPQEVLEDLVPMVAMGICCLEQYTNIYEESCPWEHDFSYDDQLKIEEAIIIMGDRIQVATHNYYHDEPDMIRSSLEEIKEMVIIGVSCLLQHGSI